MFDAVVFADIDLDVSGELVEGIPGLQPHDDQPPRRVLGPRHVAGHVVRMRRVRDERALAAATHLQARDCHRRALFGRQLVVAHERPRVRDRAVPFAEQGRRDTVLDRSARELLVDGVRVPVAVRVQRIAPLVNKHVLQREEHGIDVRDLHGRNERDHERDSDDELAAPLPVRAADDGDHQVGERPHEAELPRERGLRDRLLARVPGGRVGAGPSHEGAELPQRRDGARRVRRAHRERERERHEKYDEGPVDRKKNQGQRERQQYHVREDVEACVAWDARERSRPRQARARVADDEEQRRAKERHAQQKHGHNAGREHQEDEHGHPIPKALAFRHVDRCHVLCELLRRHLHGRHRCAVQSAVARVNLASVTA
mmetsp:Transcript_9994/g.26419  ORF Transcript_9994/g.26419 Transcript_9994/m.26419 type:complete len:372 (+) Transcript_9994:242-1357(+)